jgi:hypothetical protein
MHIFVDGTGQFSVREEQDLTALKLVTVLSPEQLLEAFHKKVVGPGFPADSEHVWISRDWLLAQGPATDEVWAHKFEKMMEYASRKGWMHPTFAAVRVHVERTPTA